MNQLQNETSPYLLQHKDNPVDWYPWGEAAFEKAKQEDKPILLSIGYSACHWCHVMAHESFENPETAQMMNTYFVNIKVDREERPDVDDIYMQAVQAMTGHGGWPMTMFLMPDGRPFYGGTYYPPEPRHGMPAFRQILLGIHEAYTNRRDEVEDSAANLTQALNRDVLGIGGDDSSLNAHLLEAATRRLLGMFDRMQGGFAGAPKFPQPMALEFLLRRYVQTQDQDVLDVVRLTLDKMARGGIYDQLGGGFARYSVDAIWLVPHFEKMLYDNAQLSRVYLQAWQATREPFYKRIAEEIYDYILREMTAPEGGFYSATDADSEGEEGKFFVWTMPEVRELLGDDANIAIEYWGMSQRGNFEGHNILNVPNDDAVVAERLNMTVTALHEKIDEIKHILYAARTQRVAPGLDDKILTAWNGLMLASLAEAARVLGREDYKQAAVRAGDFLLNTMMTADGRLLRTYKDGVARLNAYLEDYANMVDALLELYQLTFDERWFTAAQTLTERVLAHFPNAEGGFYDTSDDHEQLIVRPRNIQDNALPGGNTMMAKQLLRLAAYTGDDRYDTAARGVLRLLPNALEQYPQAFGQALNAADMLVNGIAEIAIVGDPQVEATRELLHVTHETYRPNMIVALAREDVPGETTIPLLNYRAQRGGLPTVYVCRNFTCRMPVTTPDAMRELL
ncbi:MAG: thioredoxin domain-containing protein [Anaerolineae bacterium]